MKRHAPEKKERELDLAPNGILGLEAFLPLCTPRQEDDIFGEVDRFYFEDSDGRLVRAARAPRSAGQRR